MSFITWKGWKSTFGRWYVWGPLFIHVACIVGYIVGDHWLAYTFCTAVLLTLWIYGYINWRALLRIDHKHPNAHTSKVCEECDPVQMRDGGPVVHIGWWYAATYGVTREAADQTLLGLAPHEYERYRRLHDEYLKHRKFRNYPKP